MNLLRKIVYSFSLLAVATLLTKCCLSCPANTQISSPDGKIKVVVRLVDGQLLYDVVDHGKLLLENSRLGFVLNNNVSLATGLIVSNVTQSSNDKTWEQPWGESRYVRDNYNEMSISLVKKGSKAFEFKVIFRLFNDGFGFRYEFPEQKLLHEFKILDEVTEFRFVQPEEGWWIPAYSERFYESIARKSIIFKMDTIATPVTFEGKNGKFYAIHEANLTDYAKMNLYPSDSTTLRCNLTPWSNGIKVYANTPFVTPWRTMIIAPDLNGLVTSNIMLNLNEPSKIEDTSWLKPGRYIGIWWDIHMGNFTWASGPKHGATTQNTKEYIDFASKHGFSGVLVEGWNVGWDGDWVKNGDKIEFYKPYPDFDIKEICDYAKSKNVELIGHHETGGAATHYEVQMDSAFKFYNHYGVRVVKTGYVNTYLDNTEHHDGQYGVRHYRKVVETAAKHKIVIDNHEPVMPTGIQRTYPNLMTQEAVRGQEFDAWSNDGGSPPSHTTVIPFLRGLAGPMDFTPGTFNFTNPMKPETRVRTTIAKQLALYVIIYSPLQMASDVPKNYEGFKAFDFIKSVPCDWQQTRVIDGKIGDFATFARKDRNSENWYIGSITDENSRSIELNLSFLDDDAKYKARIYKDGEEADYLTNPTAVTYEELEVTSDSIISINLAKGGGCAIELLKIN